MKPTVPLTAPPVKPVSAHTIPSENRTGYGSATPDLKPRKKFKNVLIAILSVVLVAAIVLTLVFTHTPKRPDNVMAVTYDAVKSIFLASGFDMRFVLTWDERDGDSEDMIDGRYSVLLGEGLKDSAADLVNPPMGFSGGSSSISGEAPPTYRKVLFYGDTFAFGSSNDEDFQDDDPDDYYPNEDIIDWAEEALEYELGVSVNLNAIISDHHFDAKQIFKTSKKILAALESEYNISDEIGSEIPDPEDVVKLLESFLYEKCEEAGVIENFISDLTEKSGTYEFTLDIPEFLDAFSDYLDDVQDDDDFADDKGISEDSIEACEYFADMAKSALRYMDVPDVDISLSVGKDRVLESFTFNIEVYGDDVTGTLTVEEYNGSKLDVEELESFIEEVNGYYSGYSSASSGSSTGSAAAASPDYDYSTITLKINSYAPEVSSYGLGTDSAVYALYELSGGTMSGDVYYNGTLLGSSDSVEGCADGAVDIAFVSAEALAEYASLSNIVILSFEDSEEHAYICNLDTWNRMTVEQQGWLTQAFYYGFE
ncbi:MAG: hypothetical protein LBN36_04505 [Clostridiales Family XIII bacterium]|nr:hypothetical protein [Clostridiales Family XIII bacterium]